MGANDTSDQDDADYPNGEVTANLSSLAEGNANPEVGDEVEVTVKGTVKRIEGEVACISPTTVNGQPAPPSPNNNTPDEHDQLAADAAASDNTGNGSYA